MPANCLQTGRGNRLGLTLGPARTPAPADKMDRKHRSGEGLMLTPSVRLVPARRPFRPIAPWVHHFTVAGFLPQTCTPQPQADRINNGSNRAVEWPESKENLVSPGMGSTRNRNSPAGFGDLLRSAVGKPAVAVKRARAQVEQGPVAGDFFSFNPGGKQT